jgi:protein-L-isoaspartate O-methyltransferase
MPDAFFLDQYRRKAASADPLEQAGRGTEFQGAGFVHVVKETLQLLELRPEHAVLDVGCANGLLDVELSGSCRELLALEPVPELAALARTTLAACPSARVEVGHGAAVPAPDRSFDRVLMLEVLQLVAPDEVPAIFQELRRVTRAGGRVVVSAIPDAARREAVLGPYLAGVRAASHLTADQKAAIVARNERASWYDPGTLVRWWKVLGDDAAVRRPAPDYPNAADRFHLVVTVGA